MQSNAVESGILLASTAENPVLRKKHRGKISSVLFVGVS